MKILPLNLWKKTIAGLEPVMSTDVVIPDTQRLISKSTKLAATFGSEQSTNGDLELWTLGLGSFVLGVTPWDYDVTAGYNGSVKRSTDAHYGSYAAQLTSQYDIDSGLVLSRPLVGNVIDTTSLFGPTETVRAGFHAKGDVGGEEAGIVLLNGDTGTFTHAYNFATSTWDDVSGDLSNLTLSHMYGTTLTTEYQRCNSPAFIRQATAIVGVYAVTLGNPPITIYADDFFLEPYPDDGGNYSGIYPSSWMILGSDECPILTRDAAGGSTYAVKTQGSTQLSGIMQTVTGLAPGGAYHAAVTAKSDSGSSVGNFSFYSRDDINGEYFWHFTGPSAGTWVETTPMVNLNYGFENWTGGLPDDWTVFDTSPGGTFTQSNVKVKTGSFAGKFTCIGGGAKGIRQSITGLTPADEYRVTFNLAGNGTGTEVLWLMHLNGARNMVWNWTTSSWEAYAGGAPTPDQARNYTCDIAGTYSERDERVEVAADGGMTISFFSQSGTADEIWIDDVTVRPYGGPPTGTDWYQEFITNGTYTPYNASGPYPPAPAWGTITLILFSYADDVYLDRVSLSDGGTAPTILLNGDLETWTVGGYLTDGSCETQWTEYIWPDGWVVAQKGFIEADGGQQHGGSYCAKTTLDVSDGIYMATVLTGLTAGDYYRTSLWGKYETNPSFYSVVAFNDTLDAATEVWDPTSSTWVAVGGPITPATFTLTASYANYYYDIPVPASGTLLIAISHDKDTTDNAVAYLDDISIKKVTYAPNKDIFHFHNATDPANLEVADNLVKFELAGGTGLYIFRINGLGEWHTELSSWDFAASTLPMLAKGDYEEMDTVLTKYAGKALMAKVEDVDVKSVGIVSMNFTVPANYRLIDTEIVTVVETANAPNADGIITVGTQSPFYNDIYSAISYGNTVGQMRAVTPALTPLGVGAAGNLNINITNADTGTAITISVYVFGCLVAA